MSTFRTYCTLFDHRYLPQGLALYESLKNHSSVPFTLHVLAMDDTAYDALFMLNLENVYLHRMEKFEQEMRLAEIKTSRTHQEFCWTCASQFCEYLLKSAGLPEITYCDSDVWFFANPEPVFAQIGSRSLAITPHQFPDNREKPRLSQSGQFNVGFIYFKNTPAGRKCLEKWAAQVRNRCSAKVGCGDQCYLDEWCSEYGDEVCVLGTGVNMGPWNLMAFTVSQHGGNVYLGSDILSCYHFHEYRHGERLTNYSLRQTDIDLIYRPYVESVERAKDLIEKLYLPA